MFIRGTPVSTPGSIFYGLSALIGLLKPEIYFGLYECVYSIEVEKRSPNLSTDRVPWFSVKHQSNIIPILD